jgi:membrane-associated protease RseP (regulator of RpoE activity)
MSQNIPQPLQEAAVSTTACQNCHATMPTGLRFCRNCGFRLGEGVSEYTETVRFSNGPGDPNFGFAGGQMATVAGGSFAPRKKRMSGMTWIFMGIILFFLTAGIITQFIRPAARRLTGGAPPLVAVAPRSYFGVNEFETTDGGVTFDSIEAPGSPADKAGLVGGDIITSFDGQAVKEDDELMELLGKTPIGKTVDVAYIRDGEPKLTKLTTISKGDLEQLSRVFAARPEGRGRLGIDDRQAVEIPNSKLRGVQLRGIPRSLPADMAGIKDGDIIIEFGGTPIRTDEELSHRINRAIPYETVHVIIMRGAERLDIPVRMGRQ